MINKNCFHSTLELHYHSLACFGMMSVLLLTFTVSAVSNGYQKAYAAAEFPTSDRHGCFSPNDKLVDANNNNWTDVFENVKNSVVKVETGSNPYGKPELSTGFIYDNDGHIVTNYHVANSGNLIKVIFADGNGYRAQITGTDPDSDLAILQANAALNKEQMKSLPIGNSAALQVGENVGAIGYPFEQLSFSVGSIKQLNITRENNFGSIQTGLIQHDACGYHGSSGGPLLDLQGRVLGINSYPGLQGYDIPGLTLAIPSNTLLKIVPKLISEHSHNLSLFPWS